MVLASKLKVGTFFEYKGNPWRVLEYQKKHLSRASGTVKLKVKNLKNGRVDRLTFQSAEKFNTVELEKKKLSFLYRQGERLVFMDNKSFEQMELEGKEVDDLKDYLSEGDGVEVIYWKGKAIDFDIPLKVELEVVESSPGVKGDTAVGATKKVKLETGLQVRVPLFIKKGDRLIIDTRDGSYVERAG